MRRYILYGNARTDDELGERLILVPGRDEPLNFVIMDKGGGDFTARMFAAINSMLLDMLAAVARKDYTDRRRRQSQGIAQAKTAGAYRGRREDTERNASIAAMLTAGLSCTTIQAARAARAPRLPRSRSGGTTDAA